MLNFTVGPVMSSEEVLKIGGKQTPYFRNDEFSQVMLENEELMKEFVYAEDESRVVFIIHTTLDLVRIILILSTNSALKIKNINSKTISFYHLISNVIYYNLEQMIHS